MTVSIQASQGFNLFLKQVLDIMNDNLKTLERLIHRVALERLYTF